MPYEAALLIRYQLNAVSEYTGCSLSRGVSARRVVVDDHEESIGLEEAVDSRWLDYC